MIDLPRADEIGRAAHGALGQIDTIYGVNASLSSQLPRGESLIIEGWAAEAEATAPARCIAVLIGDRYVWTAQPTISRPDVGAALGTTEARYGFLCVIDTAALTPGNHSVRIASQKADGTWRRVASVQTIRIVHAGSSVPEESLPSNHVFVDIPLLFALNRETLTATLEDTLWIRGWALDSRGRPGKGVSIVIDGAIAGEAAYGFTRPDVVATGSFPANSHRCGYRYRLSLSTLTTGTHYVHALLRDEDDRTLRSEHGVAIRVTEPDPVDRFFDVLPQPAARIDDIRSVRRDGHTEAQGHGLNVRPGDTLLVTGWALDHDNRDAAARVIVVVDGETRFDAESGLAREDVRSRYGYGGRAGFRFSISTAGLPEREYQLQIFIVKNDNRTVEFTGAAAQFTVGDSAVPPDIWIDNRA